ncbi:manganese efflux pump MntP family protein [Priestia flexa]|jgi:manganese efflux pump family protein|uniref:Putative manganese efflux pump MntP n=1 Tax=Priestia flexa TaxID=86664 RepID=A0A1N6PE51_9BACI|nr:MULTISPECIES: manganese efflux pump MntP family protein [Bacillaceae]OZT12981.1 manganese efflux pump [Priestia aryabhattai]USY55054.1 manganese efflux pump MntP family protein [Bacillus sp. 1780r2a1]MBN8253355.1 manganese efflux pump [Priestia flexa]MCA1202326.1 manganese efflux pump MntP family protein [Priestia flexa]MCG7313553.1 manganese efflux pump MntP family protein [Priestia flexa]
MDISGLISELITLVIMAFALGMDAFSVGLGMGLVRLRFRQIFYIGVIIGLFHIWMPLLGMFIGKLLSDKLGMLATYGGGVLLLILGIQMIYSSFKRDEEPFIKPVGWGLIIFALSVSLDSFSVGLSLGIFGARTFLTIMIFGVVSMLLTWLGLLLGRRVQGWLGSYSEALGGSILLAFGIKLLFQL